MSDGDGEIECIYIIDCAGLREIATTTKNSSKAFCNELLSNGAIGVPACVWAEFAEMYPAEAEALSPYVKKKIRMKKAYLIGGAAIADKMNPGFPLSPYDELTDYYAASIAKIENRTLVTNGDSQVDLYKKMKACECVQVEDLEL